MRFAPANCTKSCTGLGPIWSEITAPSSKPSAQTRYLFDAMGETTDKLQKLLESVIRRLDASQTTADERFQAQTTFNEQVSNKLKNLGKQIDLTQADVDEARKAAPTVDPAIAAAAGAISPSGLTTAAGSSTHAPSTPPVVNHHPPPPPLPLYTEGAAQLPFARLVNHGPPLLPARALAPPEPDRTGEHYTKPPKHDFPRFDGDAPRIWLERCASYFELYKVPQHSWVTTASLYMEGLAAMWLQSYRQAHPGLTWPSFRTAVEEEFGPEEFEVQMHRLLQLKQTGSVQEYRQQFETCMYHLLSLDSSLSPKFFVSQFLLGLKDELRLGVRLQSPTSITRAAVFARIQEEELEKQRVPRHRPAPVGRPPPSAALPAPLPARGAVPPR